MRLRASVAGVLITTEAMVAALQNKQTTMPGMPVGGMDLGHYRNRGRIDPRAKDACEQYCSVNIGVKITM
jgi:hypothetical protein